MSASRGQNRPCMASSIGQNQFYHIHELRTYGPSCVNRDKDGHHKTISFGGYDRAMISGQKERRTVRHAIPKEERSIQTREVKALLLQILGNTKDKEQWAESITDAFLGHNVAKKEEKKAKAAEKKARREAEAIAAVAEGKDPPRARKEEEEGTKDEVVRISHGEILWLEETARAVASGKVKAVKDIDTTGMHDGYSADIALFGRMKPSNVAGAVHMGPSYGVFASPVQDQFFTAEEELVEFASTKVAHMGTSPLMADVHYNLSVVDFNLLVLNCNGNKEEAKRLIKNHIKTVATNGSSSESNGSTGSNDVSYMLVEKLPRVRRLDLAFLKPVSSLEEAKTRMTRVRKNLDERVDEKPTPSVEFFIDSEGEAQGSIRELQEFVDKE